MAKQAGDTVVNMEGWDPHPSVPSATRWLGASDFRCDAMVFIHAWWAVCCHCSTQPALMGGKTLVDAPACSHRRLHREQAWVWGQRLLASLPGHRGSLKTSHHATVSSSLYVLRQKEAGKGGTKVPLCMKLHPAGRHVGTAWGRLHQALAMLDHMPLACTPMRHAQHNAHAHASSHIVFTVLTRETMALMWSM